MTRRMYISLLILMVLISCSKTEIVSGEYTGTASGIIIGINVHSVMRVIKVDDEQVNFECDFGGFQVSYPASKVFAGSNNRYFISNAIGIQAIVQNSQMNFEYVHPTNAQYNVVFNGSK